MSAADKPKKTSAPRTASSRVRASVSAAKRFTSAAFYRILQKLTDVDIPVGHNANYLFAALVFNDRPTYWLTTKKEIRHRSPNTASIQKIGKSKWWSRRSDAKTGIWRKKLLTSRW